MIIITHDLGVIAQLADKVAVMYAEKIVETAPVKDIFERPQHPYTQALVASIPRLGFEEARLSTIEGAPPRLSEEIKGCSFYPRCESRIGICATETPILKQIFADQSAACFIAQPESAKKAVDEAPGTKPRQFIENEAQLLNSV